MEFATLGSSGVRVSRVALGTWAIGGWLWGGTDVEESVRAIHAALDMGISTVDTAPVYGFGLSEEILADALARRRVPREQVVIATKFGMEWDDKENVWRNAKPERIRREIDDSLRRLRTDYIDLYQIHWPDPETPIAETAQAVKELYDAGKIRAVGVCNYSVEQLEEWRRHAPLHSVQPRYNLLERKIEADVLPYCREHGLAVLAYSPLARGLLTGKFTENPTFKPGDNRQTDPRFTGENYKRNLRIVDQLKAMAAEKGKTVAQLAVRWVLDQPGVTVALWGARTPAQIQEAAGVSGWQLSQEDLERIETILQEASQEAAR